MAIDDNDRAHLFETLRQQYDEDDARTLITLLGYSANPEDLATKVDLLALARQADLDELRRDVAVIQADVSTLKTDVAVIQADVATLKTDVAVLKTDMGDLKSDMAGLRSEMADLKLDFAQLGASVRDVVIEQSRTHQQWMFGLLAVYTAMAGTLVAIGAIIIS
jgi:chromosome segregation ATPase